MNFNYLGKLNLNRYFCVILILLTMEDALTLKTLQTHLTKTTITSVVSSTIGGLFLAVLLYVAFYYNTVNTLANHESKINEVIATQSVQTKDITAIKISEAEGKLNQINLEKSLAKIEQNQKETIELLIELARGQKAMIKNQ